MQHVMAIGVVGTLIGGLLFSILENPCACTEDGECFCLEQGASLHDVTEAEILRLPEPVRTQYRMFLLAWEEEYARRSEEWGRLYTTFHAEPHGPEVARAFDEQLAETHRDFLILFLQRHRLSRQRWGIDEAL